MSWLLLVIAGILEVVWAVGLKYTEGFSRLWPSVIVSAFFIASVVLLGIAVKSLPIGTAYAVWVGIGAVGAATIGMMFLGDAVTLPRVLSLLVIIVGIIGLKLSS